MISKKHLLSLAISVSVVPFAYSESAVPSLSDIEETVVTSVRISIPLSESLPTTHVISNSDIELSAARDLSSLLGRVSGLDFRDSGGRGSANGVFVRGNSPSATLILIDGVRSASATTGATDLNNIPLDSIERVEIVKGPLSSLYGADAVGGVINVITKTFTEKGLGGNISLGFGSNSLQEYGFASTYGTDNHQLGLSVNYEDTDGIDRTLRTELGNGDSDGFDQLNVGLTANLKLSESTSAKLGYLYSEGRTEFDNNFGTDLGSFTDNELQKFSADVNQFVSNTLTVNYDFSYFEDEAVTPVFGSDITTERLSLGVNASWVHSAEATFVFGADYYDDDVDTLENFPETQRDNLGVYGQALYNSGRFSGIASTRFDDNEAYGDSTTGTVALGYELVSGLEAVVSYGTSFRAPSFNELYFPGFGNPAVQPEESDSAELSLKYTQGNFNARLSVYDTQVDDLIAFEVVSFDPFVGRANNIQEASLQGVELEVAAKVYDWFINANIDYLDAVNETTDSRLTDRARVTANVSAETNIGLYSILVDWQAETGRIDGGTNIGGYGILGASIHYDINQNLMLSFRADNLLDQDYTLNLANGAANPFQTEGRVAKASVRYTF